MRVALITRRSCSWFVVLMLVVTGCTSAPEKILPPRTYTIEIKQMKFQPAELFVHQYDTVVFVNHDLVVHDITELDNKTWSSSALPVDSAWKMEVNGSSNYYCSIHPEMKGKITMQ